MSFNLPYIEVFDSQAKLDFFKKEIFIIDKCLRCKEIDQVDNKIIGLVYWKNEFPTDEEIESLLEELS